MSNALQTVQTIKRAPTDLCMRSGFLVFVRGQLSGYTDALEELWSHVEAGLLGRRFTRYRLAGQTSWTPLPEPNTQSGFSQLFAMHSPRISQWGLELAEPADDSGCLASGIRLQLSDVMPFRGIERASHLRLLLPDEISATTIAALGEWSINRLPLWWASAGFIFHYTSGTQFTAHMRMAALAKRYWGAQIQDMTALQWDALQGMPGINWLTLIGEDFAQSREMSIGSIVSRAAELGGEGVYHRRGAYGVALAAGPKPLRGDINTGEDIGAYVSVARLIQPLLLTHHTPLSGAFASSEVLEAWLGRFTNPHAWLDCDITTD